MSHKDEYHHELDLMTLYIQRAISRILLSEDRMSKYKPWTWADEDPDGHLIKAARHIMTHLNIKGGHQPPTGENHLDNAVCRLAMAITGPEMTDALKERVNNNGKD